MRVLLDTHALAWAVGDPDRLPEGVRDLIASVEHDVYVSAVSAYEIAFKVRLGRWPAMERLARYFEGICDTAGFVQLPIMASHAREAGTFSIEHRDPFDRILAAQSWLEDLTILSVDPELDHFPVRRFWD